MQLALASDPSGADFSPGPSPAARRMSKFLLAGAAVVGVGAIASQPVTQNIPAIQELQARAVQLVANVTDDPSTVYAGLFNNTLNNLEALGTAYSATPFPLLSQIVENQEGYAAKFGTAFESAGTAFQTWWETGTRESAPGQTLLANVQAALEAGDFNTAYDNFNKLVLFGIQNTVLPILTGSIFSSATTAGIPQQIAQNFADALGVTLTTGTVGFGAFQSIFAPTSGAAFEASRAIGAVTTALQAGDVETALTGLVNTPGVVADAFLNGFDYDDGDTREAWSGLFSPTGTGTRPASGGPLQQFLITIPKKIAAAIDNTPEAVTPSGITLGASTDLASTDIAKTDIAKTDIAKTDIAKTDIASTGRTLTLALTPKVPTAKVAKTPAADKLTAGEATGDTVVATKPIKKPRSLTKATNGTNAVKAASDGVSAAVKNVSDGLKKAAAGGRHASNKPASTASDSKPKHAKASDSE
ncbi:MULTISPECIES: hypothetical protein [unclassified Mycobacterium]|uniref:hypothetical protein n=1 Tax=unclassified Mycobacterium TaxID=2642494 RepID=UPI0029C60F0A|nr:MULTISPECIES: hypothetical protein [unclassified Mycobacterium]